MEHGEDPVTAARRGTSEIGLAVMATTFTILAVFLPVGFMTGIVGQFFKSFALTIAFAVAMSLLVAFTLDPMLSSRFVRYVPPEERTRTRMGRMLERWGAFYDRVDQRYHAVLGWSVRRPWAIVALATLVFLGSLSTLGVMGTEFVPVEDRGEFVVNIEAPPGTSFEQSVAYAAEVEALVRQEPEVRQIFSTIGDQGDPLRSNLRIKTTKKFERERGLQAIKRDMRERLAAVPLLRLTVADPSSCRGAVRGPAQRISAATTWRRSNASTPRWSRRFGRARRRGRRQLARAASPNGGRGEPRPRRRPRVRRRLGGVQLRAWSRASCRRACAIVQEADIRVRLAPEFRNDFQAIARTPLYRRPAPSSDGRHRRARTRGRADQHPARARRRQRRSASS